MAGSTVLSIFRFRKTVYITGAATGLMKNAINI